MPGTGTKRMAITLLRDVAAGEEICGFYPVSKKAAAKTKKER